MSWAPTSKGRFSPRSGSVRTRSRRAAIPTPSCSSAACGRPGAPRHARARAPRRRRADRPASPARGHSLLRPHGRRRPRGERSLRPRSAHRDAPLQRHASLHPPRSRHCGRCASRGDVIVQVILDGIHLAPDTAKLIWSVGGGRVALVTDSMAGAGNGDGSYSLGGLEVEIRDGVARGPDGVLAGSSLTMIEAVRNLHSPASRADALDAATAVPSRIIGRPWEGPRRRCSRGRRHPRRQPRDRPRAGRRRAQWRCLSQAPPSLCRASCSVPRFASNRLP